MAIEKLTELDDAGLVRRLAQQQHALTRARFAHSASRLENTATLRLIRKDIARIQTELRRREVVADLPKDELVRKYPVDARSLARAESEGKAGGLLAGVVDRLAE